MSDSSGDTPDWLRQHKETPSKIFLASSSDDDNIPLVLRPACDAGNTATGPNAATSKPPQDNCPVEDTVQQGDAEKPDPDLSQAGDAEQQPQTQQPLELSQQSGLPATPQVNKPPRPSTGGPTIAATIGAVPSGQLPIMLPDKLTRNKVLLELPHVPGAADGKCHGAADLSGDSGAVGRLVVSRLAAPGGGKGAAGAGASGSQGDGKGPELQVDLKGVMYSAWVLPLAGTALVLNIGPTEAKVEALFNDFIRLREAVDPYGTDDADADNALAYLLDGDDENYQPGGNEDGEQDPGKTAAKAAAGGKGAKATKPGKKTAGTEKKKPGRPKGSAGGKPLSVKGGGVSKKSGEKKTAGEKKPVKAGGKKPGSGTKSGAGAGAGKKAG